MLNMQVEKLTPAMKQYVETKKQYADCILLFRIGDFYETFFEDAHICAKVLDLVITSKNKNSEDPIPMAWIPHHSVDKYTPRLIAAGYKVAIAEQTTDPVPWKIVERVVTRIITPGTSVQDNQKQDTAYLVSITTTNEKLWFFYHIAWWDFILWEYTTKTFDDLGKLQKFVLQLQPAEIIIDTDIQMKDDLSKPFHQYLRSLISVHWVPDDAEHYVATTCNVQNITSYWKALQWGRLQAMALLLDYLKYTQKTVLTTIAKIGYHSSEGLVLMDDVTIKNLEIFASSYELSAKYSLFGILDNTKTAWGSRLLRQLLASPTCSKAELDWRLSKIESYFESNITSWIHSFFSNFSDIPKLLTLISYRRLTWTPFVRLRSVLFYSLFGLNWEILEELKKLRFDWEIVDSLKWLYHLLERALKEDWKILWDQNYIADWYDEEIDALRKFAYHSDEVLMVYQKELVSTTWINNIKLKLITNQWYFLELTTKDSEDFEQFLASHPQANDIEWKYEIVRRQTLKGNQRYTSTYLDWLQWHIIEAKEKLDAKELAVLVSLQQEVLMHMKELYFLAEKLAWLDLFTSHAIFAKEHQFVKPEITEKSTIEIQGWRHPVIEAFLPKDEPFIPNGLAIGEDEKNEYGLIHVITGPNMGGKSTYLRQSAIIVLLAHCWLFVPAQSAKIGLIDGIFARVWSWDIIAKNQSTFMTEMIEVANILNNATEKSFIIFDELGRWTSTYDGLALTKAILHYLLREIKAKTLIATHYHELIALEKENPCIKNFSVWVYETEKEVVFMKKISAWWANKSYWVDVAKLAWIPSSILDEARSLLKELEQTKNLWKSNVQWWSMQQWLFKMNEWSTHEAEYKKLKTMLKGMDLNMITPLQALQILVKIKEDL